MIKKPGLVAQAFSHSGGRGRQISVSQPGLQSEFQDTHSYLEKQNKQNQKRKEEKKEKL